MGWFSKKRVYMQSVSFQSLKGEAYGEYNQVKKDIAFGLDGHLEMFPEEIWKYKHDSKLRFNKKRLAELGAIPTTNELKTIDLNPLWTEVKEQVDDLIEILYLEDKNIIVNGVENTSPTASDLVQEYMTREGQKPYLRYNNEDNWYFFSENNSDNKDNLTVYEVSSYEFRDGNNEVALTYTPREYDENGEEVVEIDAYGEVVEPEEEVKAFNCKEYYLAKAYYVAEDDIDNELRFVLVGRIHFVSPAEPVTIDSFQFSPLLNMKTDNKILEDCKEDNSCTTEQLREVRLRKRVVDDFGTDMDSVNNLMDNGNIDYFSVGLALAPDDILRSSAVAKYFYNFFDMVGGYDATDPLEFWKIRATDSRQRVLEFEVEGLEAKISFDLKEEVVEGIIPIAENFGEYKITLRQKTLNSVIYINSIKDIYEDYIDDGETDMVLQYKAVVAQYKIDTAIGTDRDDDSYKDAVKAYNALPPSDYNSTKMSKRITYAYCTPEQFPEVLFNELNYDIASEGDDPEWIELYDIEKYKIFKTIKPNEYEKYYVEYDTSKERRVKTGHKKYRQRPIIEIKIYKQIDESNYKILTYGSGMLEYEVDDHTATLNHTTMDRRFKIFMLDGYFDNLKYKEYVAVFDRALSGISYVQEITVLSWYERPTFGRILRGVSIVMMVYSLGTSTGISAALLTLAEGIVIAAIAQAIAKEIGGTTGVILGVIAAVAMYYYVGGAGASDTSQLWLKGADMYMKLQSQRLAEDTRALNENFNRFRKEYKKKMLMLKMSMEKYDSMGYSKDAIIENIANQSYWSGETDISFSTEILGLIEEKEDQLEPVSPVDHNLAETLYNRVTEIPIEVYEFEGEMQRMKDFGDNTQKG